MWEAETPWFFPRLIRISPSFGSENNKDESTTYSFLADFGTDVRHNAPSRGYASDAVAPAKADGYEIGVRIITANPKGKRKIDKKLRPLKKI